MDNCLISGKGLQEDSSRILEAIPIEDFSECFHTWRSQMLGCMNVGGEYFEGDHIAVDCDQIYTVFLKLSR